MPMTFTEWDTVRAWGKSKLSSGLPSEAGPEAERITDYWNEKAAGDALLKQYIRHLPASNTVPWHALGECKYARFLIANANRDGSQIVMPVDPSAEEQGHTGRTAAVAVAWRMTLAQPYLWSSKMLGEVRSAPLPPHVVSRTVLPFPQLFFSFEACFPVGEAGTPMDSEMNWIYVEDCEEGFSIFTDFSKHGGAGKDTVTIMSGGVKYGAKYPDDFPGDSNLVGTLALKLMAFLASPYIALEQGKAPRQWRRALPEGTPERAEIEKTVHTVVLRHPEQHTKPRDDDADGDERERKHHWWVSGHFRAQWYASEQSHKVIWIAPHIRGDITKPLLEKVYTVVR